MNFLAHSDAARNMLQTVTDCVTGITMFDCFFSQLFSHEFNVFTQEELLSFAVYKSVALFDTLVPLKRLRDYHTRSYRLCCSFLRGHLSHLEHSQREANNRH